MNSRVKNVYFFDVRNIEGQNPPRHPVNRLELLLVLMEVFIKGEPNVMKSMSTPNSFDLIIT